jgi:hypothetical protein
MTAKPATLAASPLDAAQLKTLRDAVVRSRKVTSAASVASFNIWSTAVIAALAAPWGLIAMATGSMGDGLINLAVAAVLGFVAWNEAVGRAMLLKLQPEGARRLAVNQLFFMGFIIAYCVYSMAMLALGPPPEVAQDPDVQKLLGSIEDLYLYIGLAVYGSVIPATVVFQGGCAWYYFTRIAAVRQHLAQTPAWVTEIQRQFA